MLNSPYFTDANITANAYADSPIKSCGASGGTIILKAKNVSVLLSFLNVETLLEIAYIHCMCECTS